MCTRAYTNPVNGRHYKELPYAVYREIHERIDNELAAQDDALRLHGQHPTMRDKLRLLALYMEELDYAQGLNPTDYCLDNRRFIDAIRKGARRRVGELADEIGLKVELQVIMEQLPMVSQSLRQQLKVLS